MADIQETIADIRKKTEARFRELVEAWMQRRSTFQTTVGAMQAFNNVFDRIEAAHEREMSKNASKNGADFGQLGNAAKLREEVRALLAFAELNLKLSPDKLKEGARECCEYVALCCKSALAAPPRNCDVGTVEAQSARFREFCKKDSMDNFKATAYCAYECPCGNNYDCKLAWAQMPYEAQKGDNNG